MNNKIISLKKPPKIVAAYSVVGHKEKEGPLGQNFHDFSSDDRFGMDTWEKAESEMIRRALKGAIDKSYLNEEDIDILLAGDLLNQCVGSNYALCNFTIPYVGLYGACSTCAEGLGLGACLYSNDIISSCGITTSSHYCTSERQFRFPLEYGGQRTPTAQWTTTGSGAFILGDEGKVKITEVMFGVPIDKGITDINNMGAAMAPSAIDTLTRYFKSKNVSPDQFDMIITGDLGYEGSEILKDLMLGEGIDIRKNHKDCGLMIFDRESQDVHAGGSGCGCSAVVMASTILPLLESGKIKNILFLGTGALMNTTTLYQGKSIPGICHLVHLEGDL